MKILLVDDHQLFTDGMVMLLQQFPSNTDVQVDVAQNSRRALHLMGLEAAYDLLITDLEMGDVDEGFNLVSAIMQKKYPVPIVLLTSNNHYETMLMAYNLGVNGYLQKAARAFDIIDQLKSICGGERIFPSEFWRQYRSDNKPTRVDGRDLSKRLQQLLELINKGHSNKEISLVMNVSENTVKFHMRRLFAAFDANNRTGCLRTAREQGYL